MTGSFTGLRAPMLAALALLPVGGEAVAQERPRVSEGVSAMVTVDDPVFALTRVRVVDGTGAPARGDQTVVVTGTRITAVGPRASVPIPQGARVMELPGHTVIPGLVALHEHTYLGGLGQAIPMSSGAALYLAMGVTTAMTAGSQLPYQELNLKRTIDAGTLAGPRLHIGGPYLAGGSPRPGFVRVPESPEEVRRVVGYWAGEGATWFKILDGPSWLVRETVQAAHSLGLRVTGHLCSVTFAEAAELGIDALQHGFITNSAYVPGKRPDLCPPGNQQAQADVEVESDAVREDIRRIVAGGAHVVSTLAVYETFIAERARLNPRAMDLVEPGVRARIEAVHAGIAQRPGALPPRMLTKMMQWERMFVAAGGVLGAGSDPWGTGLMPGFGNLRNFELLVEAGFTPEESVRIVTLNGARILGEDAERGSVEVGKAADLVVIRGDPVATPGDIYEVVTVFRDGRGYDSARLRERVRGQIGAW